MRIEDEVRLDYSDVLIRPKRSRLLSRSEAQLVRTFKFPHSPKTWTGVPLIASNMDAVGTFEVAEVLAQYKMLTCLHKHYSLVDWSAAKVPSTYLSISSGIGSKDFEKIRLIVELWPDIPFICLDVANGYSRQFSDDVKDIRSGYPDHIIIAGNVATAEMTEQLIIDGADIVKVGIGPGSVCTTRRVTGIGYPQLSAVIECADAAHGLGGHIIADGGCQNSGDVAKAFGGGADFVMLGGLFAGTTEVGLSYYGSSSTIAQQKHYGEQKSYRASEGKHVMVPSKGPLSGVVQEILGGLRSACAYVGASEIRHFPKCCTFVRVNHQMNQMFENVNNG